MDSRRSECGQAGGIGPQPFIAEGFTKAFRLVLDQSVGGHCPDESDFDEMYRALGNAEQQADIRAANPEPKHCLPLQADPKYCTRCPKNPHLDGAERLNPADLYVWQSDLENIMQLLSLADAGISVPMSSLTYREVILLQAAQAEINRRKQKDMERSKKKTSREQREQLRKLGRKGVVLIDSNDSVN